MNKSAAIRDVSAGMPGASASDIADEIRARYGVEVTPGSVRAVRSRDATRGVPSSRPAAARAPYRPRKRAVPDDAGYGASGDPDDYDDDSGIGYRRPPVKPARVRPAARGVSPAAEFAEDQADEEFYALIDSVENAVRQATAGHMQQVTGNRELIQTIAEICDDPELRAANKPFAYEVMSLPDGSQTLRLYADKPAAVRPAKHDRKRKTEPGCEWCGRPVPGVSLYLVQSPVLGPRARVLCTQHAMPESTIPGTIVTPYRVYSDIYGGSAALIVPAKTPMQQLRDRIVKEPHDLHGTENRKDDMSWGTL